MCRPSSRARRIPALTERFAVVSRRLSLSVQPFYVSVLCYSFAWSDPVFMVNRKQKLATRSDVCRTWVVPNDHLRLKATEIHLWRISLALGESAAHRFRELLSSDEINLADRFHFKEDGRRFTIARGALRQILSRYLKIQPDKVLFSYAGSSKPELADCINQLNVRFNLAHSRNLALIAVAQNSRVGIDVEFVDRERDTEEIAERFFSTNEVKALRALDPAKKQEAFFDCWTRKEAYLKALGDGLSTSLSSFEVEYSPGVPAALNRADDRLDEVARWSMYEIAVGQRYRAAVVVEGKDHLLRYWQWIASFV